MRILILTGKFGMGHYSAADSIKDEIIREIDGAEVELVDLVDYILPRLKTLVYSSFDIMVKRANKIYNSFYKHTVDSDYKASIPFINKLILKMDQLIYKNKPDLVISTLPLCSRLMSEYKRRYNSTIPLITCITDVSIHNEWISPYTNLYMVGSEKVRDNLIKNGVSSEDIIVTGIPVRREFKDAKGKEDRGDKENKSEKRERTLLIMGGGLGLIPLGDGFYKEISKSKDLKVIVILGNNKKAYKKLSNKYDNIEIIGYTDKVDKYMAKADLIISKAGGITTFEAIYSRLPLLVLTPFLEQERSNASFIEENQLGEIMWDRSDDIGKRALKIINDDLSLERIQANMDGLIRNMTQTSLVENINKFKEVV